MVNALSVVVCVTFSSSASLTAAFYKIIDIVCLVLNNPASSTGGQVANLLFEITTVRRSHHRLPLLQHTHSPSSLHAGRLGFLYHLENFLDHLLLFCFTCSGTKGLQFPFTAAKYWFKRLIPPLSSFLQILQHTLFVRVHILYPYSQQQPLPSSFSVLLESLEEDILLLI